MFTVQTHWNLLNVVVVVCLGTHFITLNNDQCLRLTKHVSRLSMTIIQCKFQFKISPPVHYVYYNKYKYYNFY